MSELKDSPIDSSKPEADDAPPASHQSSTAQTLATQTVGMAQPGTLVDHDHHMADTDDPDAGWAYDSDIDSGYGDSLRNAATTISSNYANSLLQAHEYRHGRRYHGLHAGAYNFPNDEPEQARLDMLHYVFTQQLGDRLTLAPIPEDAVALDIGTATGIWPIHFGDAYPSASVVGVDLSPIQPQWVPPNVRFSVDDVELDWTDDMYDYIHCRYMAASIRDWPTLISQAFRHLRPGGWLEFQETINLPPYHCPPGAELDYDSSPEDPEVRNRIPLSEDHPLHRLMHDLGIACDQVGRDLNPGKSYRNWCIDAGFQNVRQRHFPLPIGSWPTDPQQQEIGSLMALNFSEGVEAFTAAPYVEVLGWTREEVMEFNEEVRRSMDKTEATRPVFDFVVITAQKPL